MKQQPQRFGPTRVAEKPLAGNVERGVPRCEADLTPRICERYVRALTGKHFKQVSRERLLRRRHFPRATSVVSSVTWQEVQCDVRGHLNDRCGDAGKAEKPKRQHALLAGD